MPTVEETLTDISVAVSQVAADISAIGEANTTNAGLIKLSDGTNPDDNSVPTVQFFKDRNILGSAGEAGAGLPQAQLDQIAALPAEEVLSALATLPSEQINALPATEILSALSALPASLTGLAGQVIAVNSAGNGYELVFAPVGGGGGGGGATVNIVVDRFTGDNSTTVFTLSQAAVNENALDVTVSGVTIDPADYSVAGTNLTFTAAPPATGADEILVRHLGNIAILDDGSVVTAKIVDGAVTTPKVANKAITLQKMADGTPGKFLKYNASTGIVEESDIVIPDNSISTVKVIDKNITLAKIADGTAGKFLKFNESTGVIEEADVSVPNNSIGTSKLIDKNVTLAKMADGTPGRILKFNDSTGVVEEADIATFSGAWRPVSKTEITTSVALVDIPIGSGSVYQVRYRRLRNNVHDHGLYLRFGVGGVFSGEQYNWGYIFSRGSGMTREMGGNNSDTLGMRVIHRLSDNSIQDTLQGLVTIDSPAITTNKKTIQFEWNGVNEDSSVVAGYGAGYREDNNGLSAIDTLRFEAEAGSTLEGGIFDLYELVTL